MAGLSQAAGPEGHLSPKIWQISYPDLKQGGHFIPTQYYVPLWLFRPVASAGAGEAHAPQYWADL